MGYQSLFIKSSQSLWQKGDNSMKIDKKKNKHDIWGFEVTPEKGCKLHGNMLLDYSIIKEIIDNSTTVVDNFKISSGHLVLTSISKESICIEIMDSFPKGKYTVYSWDEGNLETIFVPFKDFRGITDRFHLSQTVIHLPDNGTIQKEFVEAPFLSVNNLPLYLMDKSEWIKYKSILYSGKNQNTANIIRRLNIQQPGYALVTPLDTQSANQQNKLGKQIFNFAYTGITTEGDPAYLIISRYIR